MVYPITMTYQEVEYEIRKRFGRDAFLAADGYGNYAVLVNKFEADCIVGVKRNFGWHRSMQDALKAAIALKQ